MTNVHWKCTLPWAYAGVRRFWAFSISFCNLCTHMNPCAGLQTHQNLHTYFFTACSISHLGTVCIPLGISLANLRLSSTFSQYRYLNIRVRDSFVSLLGSKHSHETIYFFFYKSGYFLLRVPDFRLYFLWPNHRRAVSTFNCCGFVCLRVLDVLWNVSYLPFQHDRRAHAQEKIFGLLFLRRTQPLLRLLLHILLQVLPQHSTLQETVPTKRDTMPIATDYLRTTLGTIFYFASAHGNASYMGYVDPRNWKPKFVSVAALIIEALNRKLIAFYLHTTVLKKETNVQIKFWTQNHAGSFYMSSHYSHEKIWSLLSRRTCIASTTAWSQLRFFFSDLLWFPRTLTHLPLCRDISALIISIVGVLTYESLGSVLSASTCVAGSRTLSPLVYVLY